MIKDMDKVGYDKKAITGANSFIGAHLVDALVLRDDVQVRVLIHKKRNFDSHKKNNITSLEGDLLRPETLKEFVRSSNTVLNLAYLWNQTKGKNIEALANLTESCSEANIKRFIHCSTALVAGRV